MFPTEPETRPETPAERERRRARHGLDRRGLKQVAIAACLIFGSLAALAALESVGVERRLTTATVTGLVDRLHKRGGHECATQLSTGYGEALIYTRNLCRYVPWRIGDTAEVEARQMRLTGTIVVTTRGTIFSGAYTMLPDS